MLCKHNYLYTKSCLYDIDPCVSQVVNHCIYHQWNFLLAGTNKMPTDEVISTPHRSAPVITLPEWHALNTSTVPHSRGMRR